MLDLPASHVRLPTTGDARLPSVEDLEGFARQILDLEMFF